MAGLISQDPKIPEGFSGNVRYGISSEREDGFYRTYSYSPSGEGEDLSYTITSLSRNTEYSVSVRMGIGYAACGYYYSRFVHIPTWHFFDYVVFVFAKYGTLIPKLAQFALWL